MEISETTGTNAVDMAAIGISEEALGTSPTSVKEDVQSYDSHSSIGIQLYCVNRPIAPTTPEPTTSDLQQFAVVIGKLVEGFVAALKTLSDSVSSLVKELKNRPVAPTTNENAQVNGTASEENEQGVSTTSAATSALKHREGFLWKPVAEKDGKLVVLLPAELTGKVAKIELKSKSGKVLERGKFAGVANGEREHFRFSKAGGSYPDQLKVDIILKDGSHRTITVADTANRYEPKK